MARGHRQDQSHVVIPHSFRAFFIQGFAGSLSLDLRYAKVELGWPNARDGETTTSGVASSFSRWFSNQEYPVPRIYHAFFKVLGIRIQHAFGPPGSGSITQRYGSGSGSGSFLFLINMLSGLK
jgi:hypothetical protein